MPTVFLSYASEANAAPGDKESQGWVSFFDRCLKIELGRLRDVSLWRDARDFNQLGDVADKLRAAVKDAKLFLVVLSSQYKDKDYTRLELTEFFDTRAETEVATDLILPVLPRPLDPAEYPPPLHGLKYIEFFEVDSETKAVIPFYDGFGRTISEKYWKSIRQVGDFIEKWLKGQPKATKATVYLAEPGRDQISNHWSIYNELESQKCEITPGEPWPPNADTARDHLGAALKKAKFSVHLLGSTSTNARRSGLAGLTTMQIDIAAERLKQEASFRRLIWIPSNLKEPDPEQANLIKSLDDGTRLTERDELVRGGLEAFKEIIRDELSR
jgi:hypothetical protein